MSSSKRIAILEAVLDMLAKQSDISTIKVSEIAQRAGVGKGTIYEYFTSKDEMVAGAFRHLFEQCLGQLEAEVLSTKGFYDKLSAVLRVYEAAVDRYTLVLRNFVGPVDVGIFKPTPEMEIVHRVFSLFDSIIASGAEDGLFPLPSDSYITHGAIISWILRLVMLAVIPEMYPGWDNATAVNYATGILINTLNKRV